MTSGEVITDSGVITVGGTSSFTTDVANKSITLDQVNLFTGAVSIAANGATGSISLTNVGQALDLGTVTTTAGGTLVIETNTGSITDSGVVTASGTSSFTTTTANDDITLDSNNTYSGAVSMSVNGATGNISLTNAQAALDLATVTTTLGGALVIETDASSITDSGVITASGTSSFTAGTNIITLDTATNDFTGAVSLSNSGANNVVVTDANSLTLGTVNVGNNLNINIDAGTDDTASLDVSAATITAGATITVDGQGTNDSLLATNAANTWIITGSNAGNFNNGTETINFTDFGNITGGSNTDSFNFTSGTIANAVNGGSGTVNDTLTYAGGSAAAVTLTATGTVDGFKGNSTSLGSFDNINILTGSGNNDTLTGSTAGGTFTVQAVNDTYVSGGQTLNFTAIENLAGNTGNDIFNVNQVRTVNINTGAAGTNAVNVNQNLTGNIAGGAGDDTVTLTGTVNGNITDTGGTNTFNINNTLTGSLTSGAGIDTLNVNAAINGAVNTGAGNDTFELNNTITGAVTGGTGSNIFNSNNATGRIAGVLTLSGDNTWNRFAGTSLSNSVVGTGSLTVPDAGKSALVIGAGDLVLPTLTGFAGHTVIGGTLTPAGADPFYTATAVTFNSTSITVTDAISSGGSVTLLAGDIFLNNDITVTNANSLIGMVAAGPVGGGTTGVIDASAGPVTLTAPASANNPSFGLIAESTIVSSENITLIAGGAGEVDVAVGADDELEFNGASQNIDTTTDPDFEAFVTGALSAAGLSVGVITTFSINPASALIGFETLAFIDVVLFEEELTLYGQIGTGIALALAQCEEQEGCAPNVTEDEMNNLIESLEARLLELERRLAEAGDSNVRAELEELIDGFNKELKDFRGYRQELQDFFSAEEEDEDFEEDELDEDLPDDGLLDEPVDAGEVARLAKVLETVKARIKWLESLKANPNERERFSKILNKDILRDLTGDDELTIEALDTIIEATRSEAAFIENQIRLLIEGTEAMLSPAPIFTAEARDYDSIQTIHYGSGYLNGLPTKTLLNIN